MQKITLLMLALILSIGAGAQSLRKYAISNSGCSAYLFCDPGTIGHDYSEDSADVYTAECSNSGTTYSVICVKLRSPIESLGKAEDVLIKYMDYLKESFKITKSAGYGKGHRLKGSERTRGVIDYWEDPEKTSWKVKGWTDGNYICVLCASDQGELPETKINIFLDGLVLPGI